MHYWDDEWFEKYGDDLYAAMDYIRRYVRKYSRCHVSMKEKYGTIRYEYIFPPWGSVWIRHYIKSPFKKTVEIDGHKFTYRPYLWAWTGSHSWIYRTWTRYGRYILKKAVINACINYPYVIPEILADYDKGEFISG